MATSMLDALVKSLPESLAFEWPTVGLKFGPELAVTPLGSVCEGNYNGKNVIVLVSSVLARCDGVLP
jgi:hypothetical protein